MKKYIAVIILAIGLGAVVESQTSYIYWTVGLNTPAVTTTTLTVTGNVLFGGTTNAFPALKRTAADIEIVDAAAGITSGLIIQSIKATSGTRFVCVDTNGKLVSSTTACSGT
jgi:hypothetical protein